MPNVYQNINDLNAAIQSSVLTAEQIDDLVYTSTFSEDTETRDYARKIIREATNQKDCAANSIQTLYEAMGRKEVTGITVPAINIRTMTYDVARSIMRVAKKLSMGPVLFEIARSEVGYTSQRPAEYATCILAAALREEWPHPVFIQGDHFQINATKYHQNADAEVQAVKDLIAEGIEAGFYNIDIDTSTLVDLSYDSLEDQQRLNYEIGAILNKHVRELEPQGITVSIGGEIGEVGKKNSTPEELKAYMEGYAKNIPNGMKGISKISVQTGTSHGGVVLPDGSIADVNVDFETLKELSRVAQDEYGISGAVQHGASTLPDSMFHKFAECNASEIHLATGFQNIIYDHTPKELLDKVYAWLAANCDDERKADQTDEQFYYKTRKKGFAAHKWEFWNLPEDVKGPMFAELEAKFELIFGKLGLAGSQSILSRYYN